MDSSIATLSKRRSSAQQRTRLGQLCGTGLLFRDRYKLLRTLGQGGFGVTFLAKDEALPSSPFCVIKQLCPKVDNPAVLKKASERFEREASILGRLGSHSQIPHLLNYFQIEDEFFLVQEYVKGVTLAKLVRSKGPLTEPVVKQYLRELLPVLSFVHGNQMIHRDIKPPNIIRCLDDDRLVLIDFGAVKEEIAQLTELDTAEDTNSPTTNFVGTVGFAPPEQLSLRPIYASDIYALGVTCLFLLTGHPPLAFDYDPRTGEILWQEHVEVSDHFAKVLDKMLKISPRDRYQSADQVLRALELEDHLDSLSPCMNTMPRPMRRDEFYDSAGYLPPIARTAASIRGWRNRMQQRQRSERSKRSHRPNNPSGYLG
jgi:serine/threonine protein kinase